MSRAPIVGWVEPEVRPTGAVAPLARRIGCPAPVTRRQDGPAVRNDNYLTLENRQTESADCAGLVGREEQSANGDQRPLKRKVEAEGERKKAPNKANLK